ncbi:MAG: ABC transporter ATP-binding protein, partial [Oscillospiraceae bacterium]|nr:ABC transporter ATP-binding protein [Oscillospiraceae bacterium]
MQKNFFDHPLKVFMSYYRPHRRMFAIDLSCAVLASAVDLIFPYVSKTSMQRYLPEKLYTTFFIVMAIVAASYVVKALLYYVIAYVGHTMGTLIEADMRSDIFRHMQNLSYSFYDKNRTGVLMSRITNDLFDITELAHHGPENFLICTLTLAGSIIILFTIQWKLALVILILVPLCIAMTVKQRIKLRNT